MLDKLNYSAYTSINPLSLPELHSLTQRFVDQGGGCSQLRFLALGELGTALLFHTPLYGE
jgi:hypothetical protein